MSNFLQNDIVDMKKQLDGAEKSTKASTFAVETEPEIVFEAQTALMTGELQTCQRVQQHVGHAQVDCWSHS